MARPLALLAGEPRCARRRRAERQAGIHERVIHRGGRFLRAFWLWPQRGSSSGHRPIHRIGSVAQSVRSHWTRDGTSAIVHHSRDAGTFPLERTLPLAQLCKSACLNTHSPWSGVCSARGSAPTRTCGLSLAKFEGSRRGRFGHEQLIQNRAQIRPIREAVDRC